MLILPMAGINPIIVIAETAAGTPVPANVSGVWVEMTAQGGTGGTGGHVANENQNCAGGGGGGGGSTIERFFIPATLLGTTYRATKGTTSSRFAQFVCGGVTVQAGWGANGSGRTAGAGGVASVTGFDVPASVLHDGTAGGTGGASTPAAGSPSADNITGGSSGGGGGGGSRSSSGGPKAGGAAGTAILPGLKGNNGASGRASGNGADGGTGGTGGGVAAFKLEWV